jgi:hypothetical protein
MQSEEAAQLENIYGRLARLQVDPHDSGGLSFSADAEVLEDNSKGLTRKNQALAAATSPATRYAELEQRFDGESVRLFVGVHPIRTKSARFLLILVGFRATDKPMRSLPHFACIPVIRTSMNGCSAIRAWHSQRSLLNMVPSTTLSAGSAPCSNHLLTSNASVSSCRTEWSYQTWPKPLGLTQTLKR